MQQWGGWITVRKTRWPARRSWCPLSLVETFILNLPVSCHLQRGLLCKNCFTSAPPHPPPNHHSYKYTLYTWTIYTIPVQFSRSVVSDSLRPHGLQHARPLCSSPTPGVYSNSCLLSRWCHPTISTSVVPFSSPPSIFPSIRVFSNELVLPIR